MTEQPTRISVGDLEIRFLVQDSDSNGALTMFECRVPAGARVPAAHSHDGFEETIYGLEGITTWMVEGEAREIGVGDALCIVRGLVHGFVNHGTTDARFLAVVAPGVLGPSYFKDIGAVLAADGPPDPVTIAEVMRRHGLTPAAQPE